MKKALRITAYVLFAIGLILVFFAVGTSDAYVIELGQKEPQYVWKVMWTGAALMAPAVITMLWDGRNEWYIDWN